MSSSVSPISSTLDDSSILVLGAADAPAANIVRRQSTLTDLAELQDPYAIRRTPHVAQVHSYDWKYRYMPIAQLTQKTLRLAKTKGKTNNNGCEAETKAASCPFLPRSKVSDSFEVFPIISTSPTSQFLPDMQGIGFMYLDSEFEAAKAVRCPPIAEVQPAADETETPPAETPPVPVDRMTLAGPFECPDDEVVRGITMSGSVGDILALKSFIIPGIDSDYTHSVCASSSSVVAADDGQRQYSTRHVEMKVIRATSIHSLPDDILRIIFLYIPVVILSYNEADRLLASTEPAYKEAAEEMYERLGISVPAHLHHPLSGWDTMLSLSHVCRRWYLVLNYAPHWTLLRRDMHLVDLFDSPMFQVPSSKKKKAALSQEALGVLPMMAFYRTLVNYNKRVMTRDDIHNERRLVAVCYQHVRQQGSLRKRDIAREVIFLLILVALVVGHYVMVVYVIPYLRPAVSGNGAVALVVCGVSFLVFVIAHILSCFAPEEWFVPDRESMDPKVRHESCPVLGTGRPIATVCNTVPILSLFFHLALIIPLALVWIRVTDLRELEELGVYSPAARACGVGGFLAEDSYGMAAPLTPPFIELPAPLSDPRWFLVDTGVPGTQDRPRLSGLLAEEMSNRSAYYLLQQCATLGIGCHRLLWFDANFSHPAFGATADDLIPATWDTLVGDAGAAVVADATELLLAVTAEALGWNYFLSSNTTSYNDSSPFMNATIAAQSLSPDPMPSPSWCPDGQLRGILVALAEQEAEVSDLRIAFRPSTHYRSAVRSRLASMRAFESQLRGGAPYDATALGPFQEAFLNGATQYRGAYRRAVISSDGSRPLTDTWYGQDQLFFTNMVAVEYPSTNATLANATVTVVNSIVPFWRFAGSPFALRNGTLPVPLIVSTTEGSYSFSIETISHRYIVGAHVVVALLVALMVAIGLGGIPLATRRGPTDKALWLMWGAKVLVLVIGSPMTMVVFGSVCLVGGTSKPVDKQYLLSDSISDGNPWLMCDDAGGLALIILGSIMCGIAFFLYVVDKLLSLCKQHDAELHAEELKEVRKKIMPTRPYPRLV